MAAASIAVLGAGSIGCFVGGAWALAGLGVTLIGRERLQRDVAEHGLNLSDHGGWSGQVDCRFTTDPAALAQADIILLTVKGGSTAEAAEQIAHHGREGAVVISFQNGVGNKPLLEGVLGDRFTVVQGMVPYNVVYLGHGRFHKGVAGALWAEDMPAMRELAARVASSREPLRLSTDMAGVAWGKLLINLNNAVNALSGRTLLEQLGERAIARRGRFAARGACVAAPRRGSSRRRSGLSRRGWRRGNRLARLFQTPVRAALENREKARSSMSDDLAQGRRTEADQLNGEVVRLAERLGRDAPINRRIVELLRAAEAGAPSLSPEELQRKVLGR